MKWIMIRSLPYSHEFELEGDESTELNLSCRESEIMYKMKKLFGSNVEVQLFEEES